jgi:hypothetical protein
MGLLRSKFIGIGVKTNQMEYLVRVKKGGKAHLWDDGDSYCRMYSTNGMKKKKYHVVKETTKEICLMCDNVYEEYSGVRFTNK